MQGKKSFTPQLFVSVNLLDLVPEDNFYRIADNGKSICEGRAKFNCKFNFDRTKQIAFSDC